MQALSYFKSKYWILFFINIFQEMTHNRILILAVGLLLLAFIGSAFPTFEEYIESYHKVYAD